MTSEELKMQCPCKWRVIHTSSHETLLNSSKKGEITIHWNVKIITLLPLFSIPEILFLSRMLTPALTSAYSEMFKTVTTLCFGTKGHNIHMLPELLNLHTRKFIIVLSTDNNGTAIIELVRVHM